ncbi:TonB-dependent receptor [Terriglobus sp.]|uniref:TonB-dependent receptor n=1 Tax=Terriglobus sp. TaxID=1889013 RepID=UPI003AFFD601
MPAFFVLLPSSIYCQAGRGTLSGTITDARGGALQGARVELQPGRTSTSTDAQGQFTFLSIPTGPYSIVVTYSGFQTLTQSVTVSETATRFDATLTIGSAAQSVQVYADRQGGELEAINRTFNADNIINVLPADVIVSLPNANVADAIGRLAGVTLERDEGEGKYVKVRGTEPRLTHTTLDGVNLASPEAVRQIKLDLIPANLVESVQINKTLQANMEGDGIGGSVDLRTKSAEDRPTLYLESTGGYTPILEGRSKYQFDGTVGKRFLDGKKLGLLFGASYDFNGEGINDIEPGPALAGTYDLRDYRYFRDRWGLGGTFDYRITDTSSLYLKYLYAHFKNFGDDWIYSPAIQSFADSTTLTQSGTDGTVSFSALRRRPIQDIGGLQLGGHHVIGRSIFGWDLDSSLARTRDAGYDNSSFGASSASNPDNNIQYNLDVSHPLTPHLNVQNGVNIFDPTHLFFQRRQQQNTYSPEVDLGFGASLAVAYSLGGQSSIFEFGGRFRNEHKFVNQDTRLFYAAGTTFSYSGRPRYVESPSGALSNFINDFKDPNYYSNRYAFGPGADVEQLRNFAGQADLGVGDNVGNSFNQIEKVSAGYLMNTINLNRCRVILGLRFEDTSENNLGYLGQSRSTTAGTTPIRIQNSYLDVLPSASVRYEINPRSGIRLVYGRGLSRPNFGDLIPFQSAPSGGVARNTVSQGNPNLKSEYADNIDLLYENNLSHQGLLQAGFFYKHFTNPILPTQSLVAPNPSVTGNNLPYFLNQTINAGSAWVYGLEVSFQQHFSYLPGLLSGLGLSANYAYTNSQANLPPYVDLTDPAVPVDTISGPNRGPEGANPALIGQAPNSYNVSPTYDKKNLSVRLGMTYNQANISSYNYDTSNSGPISQGGGGGGIHGPNGDQYFYSHLQIDLQGTYTLPKGFQAVVYGLNLNNEVFGFYNGSTQFPVQREFYRPTVGGGLRWSLPNRK